jgi:hypothetical protein
MALDFSVPPTREEFVERIREFSRDRYPGTKLVYDQENFAISAGDGIWYLKNVFEEYGRLEPTDRQDYLERNVAAMIRPDFSVPEYADVEKNLLPAVRDRMMIAQADLDFGQPPSLDALAKAPSVFPHTVIGEHFVSVVAIDTEQSVSYVNDKILEGWGKSAEKLAPLAMANLQAISKQPFNEIADGVFGSVWQDSYDTSRILLIDKVAAECKVKGAPLAFLPNRDHAFVVGADDVAGIRLVMEICQELQALPRAMSAIPLVLRDGHWHEFQAAKDHPCFYDLRLARLSALNFIYQESATSLIARFGPDFFVAAFNLFEKPVEGHVICFSNSVWSQQSLLPKTEWISFVEVDAQTLESKYLGMTAWENVAKTLPGKLVPTLAYPPRFFVESFLSAEEVQSLQLVPGNLEETVVPPFPQESRPYIEILQEARERYLDSARNLIEQFAGRPNSGAEIQGNAPEWAETFFFGTRRLPFVLSEESGVRAMQIAVPNLTILPTAYMTPSAITLLLRPFAWNKMTFLCNRFDRNSEHLKEWCTFWLNLADNFPPGKDGLMGAVYAVSVPEESEEYTTFFVDFGSAPLDAFESLLQALAASGVNQVAVSSHWYVPPVG